MSVLGMGGVGRVPLTPVQTPVPALALFLSFVNAAVSSAPVNLTADVVMTTSIGAAIYLTNASNPMALPLVLSSVGAPTSAAAALPLPRLENRLVPCPAVPNEAGVI